MWLLSSEATNQFNVSRPVGLCADSYSLVEFDATLTLNVTSADGFYDGFAPRPNATVRARMRRDGLPLSTLLLASPPL